MSKKYKNLPVHIVEYHNDALEHIYRAIGSKHLPMYDSVLLHFDAHPDMIIPDIIAEEVFDKEKLYNSLSIENWITPALFVGHFSIVIWAKAVWAEQIKDGDYKFSIGRHSETSKLRVSFADDYFLSECLYAPEQELSDAKKIEFSVKTCENNSKPDANFCNIFEDKPYILDIDLDFFSTKNPIKDIFPYEEYLRLKSVYEFQPPKSRTESNLKICSENRQKLLKQLKNTLIDIENGDTEKCDESDTFKTLESIYENVKKSKFGDEIDANLLHEFGCTCDDPELPYHVSSVEEIDDLISSMEKHLKCLPRPPTLVTVSRSSIDDYCPPHQVEMIQEKVLKCLENLYKNIEVFYHYKDE